MFVQALLIWICPRHGAAKCVRFLNESRYTFARRYARNAPVSRGSFDIVRSEAGRDAVLSGSGRGHGVRCKLVYGAKGRRDGTFSAAARIDGKGCSEVVRALVNTPVERTGRMRQHRRNVRRVRAGT